MRLAKWLAPAVLAVVTASAFVATQVGAQEAPPPTAGKTLTTDLDAPRNMKMGPDGMIYVAEAGHAGTIDAGEGGKSGLTGRISKVDPATGARTTVADKLPSNGGDEGDAVGPADVAFVGSKLYYLQTHGGDAYGFPDNPTGIYEVKSDGSTVLFANIGDFNLDNLPPSLTSGSQEDNEQGGNPYSMIVRDDAFWVVDANYNRVIRVGLADRVITIAAQFQEHVVPTGITLGSSGPFYVTGLGTFPFKDEDGKVFTVSRNGQSITEIASGLGSLTDVELGPGGNIYAAAFGQQDPAMDPAPWKLFSSRIGKVNSDGTITPVVGGFLFIGGILFDGNTAYVTDMTVPTPLGAGRMTKIENFSTVSLPSASPTAAAGSPVATPTRAGVRPPDTGNGGYAGGSSSSPMLAVVALFAAAAVFAGGALAVRRTR